MRARQSTILVSAVLFAACGGGGSGTAAPVPSDDAATPIAAVQGRGAESPLEGGEVTVRGIVSGDFQDNDGDPSNNLGGFYLQSEIRDSDAQTSDGIFVFDGGSPSVDVQVGDRVTVRGTVQEHFGETQIAARDVTVTGSGVAQAVEIALPTAATVVNSDGDPLADLEAYEGMLVRFPQELTVTELRNLERFGSMRLAAGGRLFQFTNRSAPDAAGYRAHRDANAARSIELDDGLRAADVRPVRFLDAGAPPDAEIRIGDRVTGVTGNLRYSRGSGGSGEEAWRVMPVADPVFVAANPRPAAPAVDGLLKVASFNVLNYFSTIDDGRDTCGPSANENCRGADSAAEQERQLAKISTALAMIDADVVGLMELENNARASLDDIVVALNGALGAGTYDYLDTGTIGDDVIKTGFIFKPATVSPSGEFAILDSSVDARFNDARNRPALAQTFAATAGGALTVVVNHFKSKGSDCADDGDPNTGDGQGNCNLTRTRAAEALVDWLDGDPTASGDDDFLVIGDLNAYLAEDPLTAFRNADYVNLVERAAGDRAYSFVFDGQAGALDHALASPALAGQVVATREWHINADEARARDYNLEHDRDPAEFDPASPYRASDHDPVIVGIDLN